MNRALIMTVEIRIILIFISILVTSCKTSSVGGEKHFNDSPVSSVGIVGVKEDKFFSNTFIENGAPFLEERIKLSSKKKGMDKSEIQHLQSRFFLQKKDSAQAPSQFYHIEISDKVAFIRELNKSVNQDLKKYLELTEKEVVVTSIDIYFPIEIALKVDEALDVYLISNNLSSFALQLLNRDGTKEIIDFGQGVIVDYSCSAFCWTEDYRGRPVISALRNPGNACPGKTVKNPSKLEKKDLFESLR